MAFIYSCFEICFWFTFSKSFLKKKKSCNSMKFSKNKQLCKVFSHRKLGHDLYLCFFSSIIFHICFLSLLNSLSSPSYISFQRTSSVFFFLFYFSNSCIFYYDNCIYFSFFVIIFISFLNMELNLKKLQTI